MKYLQMLAYAMVIAIFVFIMAIANNCSRLPSSPVEGFSGGDTIDIALLYGPGNYYIYSDTLSGINLEIAKEFGEATKTPVKTWAIADAADGMAKLRAGAFDILASLPLDNDVKKSFPVSESIFLDRLVLVQLQDSVSGQKAVNSSLDLNGKTVYVAPGSSAARRMKNLAQEIGGKIEIIEEPDLSDELLTLKVANGSIPFAVVNEKVARALAQNYPNLNYDSSVSFTQFQVWLFNPSDSDLFRKFNTWYDSFRSSDDYRIIISRF